ncbi:MAG: hypothetical protein IKG14_05020 [Clostridia bacterium]|nr:hypothetical protein [Clostridia bacterium]
MNLLITNLLVKGDLVLIMIIGFLTFAMIVTVIIMNFGTQIHFLDGSLILQIYTTE